MPPESTSTDFIGFDQNKFDNKGSHVGKAMLPNSTDNGLNFNYSIDDYLRSFVAKGGDDIAEKYEKYLAKSGVSIPPSMQSFVTMSYMPDLSNSGVVQWQGIPPESLSKMAQENVTPQMIIGMRIADVLSFSSLSHKSWKRGFRIEPRDTTAGKNKDIAKDILEAENFILNCNMEFSGPERDAAGYTSFRQFLATLTRTSLTYDGMAIWTDRNDEDGKILAFKCLDAGSIRMTLPSGYQGDPKIFAVAVDKTGTIIHTFKRSELVWYVRNPSANPDMYGYGLPEIQIGVRLIQGFQNALDLNVDTFNRNKVPNGMLLLKGVGWTQRQLDVLGRLWTNMKAGVTKSWTLPALAVPKDGDIDILDLTDIKGKEAYYQDLMNMTIGAFCTIFRFPPHRLGYKISGKGPDSELQNQAATDRIDQEDIGKEELLDHIELVINEYILWQRYPHLMFSFTGKNPKEDAREYEERKLSMNMKERRAMVGLKSFKDSIPKDATNRAKLIEMAELMDAAPVDPSLTGIYQSVISGQSEGLSGARMTSNIDPAESESHGAISGVRRHNNDEK